MMYSISTFITSSHAPQTSFTFHPIPSNDGVEHGAAYLFNKNTDGEWYLPEFEGDYQNPIVGESQDDRFGASVAIDDGTFIVGAPFGSSDNTGEAIAYTYESVTSP